MSTCYGSQLDYSSKPRVVLCHRTALRVLRVFDPSELSRVGANTTVLPHAAPSRRETVRAVRRLESFHPGVGNLLPAHIVVGSYVRPRISSFCVPHSCARPLPGTAFVNWDNECFVCRPEYVFLQMASCEHNFIRLVALGYELCGSYQTSQTASLDSYQVKPLTNSASLLRFARNNSSLPGSKRARQALQYVADGSASARETALAMVLGLPRRYGGYGLGVPRMNYKVQATQEAADIAGRHSFRCDVCWPAANLDVEYQSRESHEGEANRERDSRRANALHAMGWTVLQVTNREFESSQATGVIAHTINRLIGKHWRQETEEFRFRNAQLRSLLGLPASFI